MQREEFKRLGVVGDGPSLYDHELSRRGSDREEIFKFVANGLLYRGSKPVMWSVVEKTALAEAEIEYEELTSDAIYAAFPVRRVRDVKIVGWDLELAQKRGTSRTGQGCRLDDDTVDVAGQ